MTHYVIRLFQCVCVCSIFVFSSARALDECSGNMACQMKRYKELNKSLNDEKKMKDEIEYLTNEMRYKAGHSLKVKVVSKQKQSKKTYLCLLLNQKENASCYLNQLQLRFEPSSPRSSLLKDFKILEVNGQKSNKDGSFSYTENWGINTAQVSIQSKKYPEIVFDTTIVLQKRNERRNDCLLVGVCGFLFLYFFVQIKRIRERRNYKVKESI